MTKTYVLDTNVLLSDPDSIHSFEDNDYGSMSEDTYNDDIPPQVLAMAGMGGNSTKKDPTYNAKDAMKLQQMYQKTSESRRGFKNGSGGGSFSRSG